MASDRRSSVLIVTTACLLTSLFAVRALASPTAAERDTARALMDAGDQLRAAGELPAAMARYQAAHAIMHVPTTGFDLARVQAQLGLLVEARATAIEVRNMPSTENEPEVFRQARKDALALSAELEPRVPSLRTSVMPPEARYSLAIDAVTLPEKAHAVAFRMNPGPHTVRVAAPGYATQTRSIQVAEGQALAVTVVLVRVPTEPAHAPPAAVASAPHAEPQSQRDDAGRLRGIVGLSVGGAVLAVGAVTGILSLTETNREKAACDGGHCYVDRRAALSRANTLANVANVTIPLGLLGIGYGLFELLRLPSSEKEQTGDSVRVELGLGSATIRGAL